MLDVEILEIQPKVSVILPTYNEKGGIVQLIMAILSELHGSDLEIILVDDDSSDGTVDAVRAAFAEDSCVQVVVRTTDKGLAHSIECGLRKASGDYLVVMDSDFNHQPCYLPFMIHSLRYYGFVSGSRFLYGGSMDTRVRHFMSWIFNIFVRFVTGGAVTDNLYGLFACRRSFLFQYEKYFPFIFRGFGEYYIRLLYLLQRDEVRILQFPAINGERLFGKGNSPFVKCLYVYSKATLTCKKMLL